MLWLSPNQQPVCHGCLITGCGRHNLKSFTFLTLPFHLVPTALRPAEDRGPERTECRSYVRPRATGVFCDKPRVEQPVLESPNQGENDLRLAHRHRSDSPSSPPIIKNENLSNELSLPLHSPASIGRTLNGDVQVKFFTILAVVLATIDGTSQAVCYPRPLSLLAITDDFRLQQLATETTGLYPDAGYV